MPQSPEMVRISARCTAYLQRPGGWFLNNSGWIAGDEQRLLVDTCATEHRTRRLLAACHENDTTGTPPSVVLTHGHGDHAHGAGIAANDGGTIMASSAAADETMSGPHTLPDVFNCEDWGNIPAPNDIQVLTTPGATSLDLGGILVEVWPVPITAHTAGDVVVWVPSERTLFSGDLMFDGVTPLALSGSIRGWLDALDWLESFDATTLVPGHGPVTTDPAKPIRTLRDYFQWLVGAVSGGEPDFVDLERQARTRYHGWLDAERHALNLRVAHAEALGQTLSFPAGLDVIRRSAGGRIPLDLQM